MGYHYFNKELIDDLVVDARRPEGLVYTSGPDGQLRLVAVEYIVPGPNSNPPGVSEPPTVLGIQMHILVPAVGFYIQHFWVWSHNPQACTWTESRAQLPVAPSQRDPPGLQAVHGRDR
jgi:hypothetical protein